jgi:tight adherence protein B
VQLLFAALVFLIVTLILVGIYVLMQGPKHEDIIRNRLEAIDKGAAFHKDPRTMDLVRDELLSTIPAFNTILVRWSWPRRLRNFIGQAGMEIKPGKFVIISIAAGVATLEVVEILKSNLWMAAAAGLTAFSAPLIFVAIMRARRLAAFERAFPDVIELLARSARAGHSFASGIEIVSTDLPDPAATEFRIVFDEQRFGLPLREALMGLCERIPLGEVRLFVIALLVQRETGGNLAEILDNLSHVIRERFRIAGDVRVRTAQGRLTAVILISLPLVLLFMLHLIDPEYINELFVNRVGQIMLIVSAVMQTLGGIIIWRIVSIKV